MVRGVAVGRQKFTYRKFCQLAVILAAELLLVNDDVDGCGNLVEKQQFFRQGEWR